MKKLLITISVFLSIPVVFASTAIDEGGYYGGGSLKSTVFSDVYAEYPYEPSVAYLKYTGVVKGYGDGTFKPDQTISRAEFMKIVIASSVKNPSGSYCFKDVKNEWFAPYICAAKKKGIVSGYPDGTFQPERNISLSEASKIVVKTYELSTIKPSTSDPWYKPFILSLEGSKALPVTIDYLDKKLTRGEMSEMAARLKQNVTNKPSKSYAALTAKLPDIGSCEELKAKLTMRQYGSAVQSMTFAKFSESEDAVMAPMAAEGEGLGGGGGNDFSTTNVQVEGVDEADTVKNDGKYIYLVRDRNVRILDAYPASGMKEISKIVFADEQFYPQEMYLSGNTLGVIGGTYAQGKNRTKLYLYDVTDRTAPKEARSLEFDGGYVSSRKIGQQVYLVMNEYPDIYNILKEDIPVLELVPYFRDSLTGAEKPIAPCSSISFYPRYRDPNYLIVAGVSLDTHESKVTREVLMGAGATIYASKDSLYVAAPHREYDELVRYSIWDPPVTDEKTTIYRFSLSGVDVAFKTQGMVPGHILNQFSMDENNGFFRIATTKGQVWNTSQPSTNNLYILNRNNLSETAGKIEGMAKGETIYSVRFIGDRAYMVTFKKIDPFFVIDVANPSNPKILGSLKIPGFSNYLHPFDEDHVIGFGKDTVSPSEQEKLSWGGDFDFAWYQGMKIALFDVTDISNPVVMFTEMIGDRGTDSELLYNHKALMYDKKRNLFAFPVSVAEIPETEKASATGSTYGQQVFQGAYVYMLDLENGFQLKGKITHNDSPEKLYYENSIGRILSINNYLYTLSFGKAKATFLDTMKDLATVIFTDGLNIEESVK